MLQVNNLLKEYQQLQHLVVHISILSFSRFPRVLIDETYYTNYQHELIYAGKYDNAREMQDLSWIHGKQWRRNLSQGRLQTGKSSFPNHSISWAALSPKHP